MTPHRGRLELYVDILKAVEEGNRKRTRIMYKSNLSWKPLMEILDSMIEQDIIVAEKHGENTNYKITEKGKNVLNYFLKVVELVEVK